jgi:hypothetical protein
MPFISPGNLQFLSKNDEKRANFFKQSFLTDPWIKCIFFAIIIDKRTVTETISIGKKMRKKYIDIIKNKYFVAKFRTERKWLDDYEDTEVFTDYDNNDIYVFDENKKYLAYWTKEYKYRGDHDNPVVFYKSKKTIGEYGIDNLKFFTESYIRSFLKDRGCNIDLKNEIDKIIFGIKNQEDLKNILWGLHILKTIIYSRGVDSVDDYYNNFLFSGKYGSEEIGLTKDLEMYYIKNQFPKDMFINDKPEYSEEIPDYYDYND